MGSEKLLVGARHAVPINQGKQMQTFTKDELLRYSRHISLPEVGMEGQKKLSRASVLCVGAGGLGSPLLLYLAAAGVGTIGVVDDDLVETTNLQRQVLYTNADVGTKKVLAAQAKLQALNPHINLRLHDARLTRDNALDIVSQYDIVADGSDNFATRYLVNDACFHLNKSNVYASIFQFQGQCTVFAANNRPIGFQSRVDKGAIAPCPPKQGNGGHATLSPPYEGDGYAPCYRCLYPEPPEQMPNCAEGGVLGVLPGLLGTIQATEVLKLILGIGVPLIGKLLTVNALTMEFRDFTISRDPACCLCVDHQAFVDLPYHDDVVTCEAKMNTPIISSITLEELKLLQEEKTPFTLLDVRDPEEYAEWNLGGKLIPLRELSERLSELGDKTTPIVVHCKAGIRSQRAATILLEAGFHSITCLLPEEFK